MDMPMPMPRFRPACRYDRGAAVALARALRAAGLLIVSALAPAVVAAGPIDLQDDAAFKTRDGTTVRATVFRFQASAVRMQVLPTLGLLPQGTYQRAGLSIEDAVKVKALARLSDGDMLIANGGFSGAKVDRPIGLVMSGGNAISLPDYSVQRGDPASACPALRVDRPRRSGVLCVDPQGQILVQHLDTVEFESCVDAVQAGPLLVEAPGRNGICEQQTGDRAFLRTALCTRKTGAAAVVVTLDPVSLFDLAQWLAAPAAQGGLACDAALNLSGHTSSGALLRKGDAKAPWRKFGDGSFPLPNLIVITERAARTGVRPAAPARVLVPQQTRRLAP